MRIIFRGGDNETVEVEEIENGFVRVTYTNNETQATAQGIANVRTEPKICAWVNFGNEFMTGLKEDILARAKQGT